MHNSRYGSNRESWNILKIDSTVKTNNSINNWYKKIENFFSLKEKDRRNSLI